MTTLEARLALLEAQVGAAENAALALAASLKRLQKAVDCGHLTEIDKSLPSVAQSAEEVRKLALALSEPWNPDVRQYLERGYVSELLQEAKTQGVHLIERDGRLFCFPFAITIDAREAIVRLGKKKEQRLRPKSLLAVLAAMQRKRLRFND